MLLCFPAGRAEAAKSNSIETLRQLGKAFAEIAETTSPAVVGVKAESSARGGREEPWVQPWPFEEPFHDFDDDFFDRFFRRRPYGRRQVPRRRQLAQGSGFIISEDGYILTNNHLVGKADKVLIKLAGGREMEAKIIGTDPESDVAVVKIDAEDLPKLRLADSDSLEVGEWVIAIGNPFGLSHTVTAGIVSAKGRSNVGIAAYEDFIQTDAAINPGNSGGPLLNLNGEVVGINTAIMSRSGGYMGIGFAIPVNMARVVYDQLIEGGTVTRGFLGVVIQNLTPELASGFGLPEDTRGVLIPEVLEDSAAEKAGLRHNDIIVELNGRPVGKADVFRNSVAMLKPGTGIEVTVLRGGEKKAFSVELGRRPRTYAGAGTGSEILQKLGFDVQDLTDDVARRLGYENLSGVVVSRVEPGSLADLAGIAPGTLIMEVDRKPIANTEEFEEAVGKAAGQDSVMLLLRDRNYTRFIVLTMPEE
jgi:serine protease Do